MWQLKFICAALWAKHARKFSQIGFKEQGQYVKNENKETRIHLYIYSIFEVGT